MQVVAEEIVLDLPRINQTTNSTIKLTINTQSKENCVETQMKSKIVEEFLREKKSITVRAQMKRIGRRDFFDSLDSNLEV